MTPEQLHALAEKCKATTTQLSLQDGLHFIFFEKDVEKTPQQSGTTPTEILSKKALLFADKAIFVTKPIVSGYNETSEYQFRTWRSDASEIRKLFAVPEGRIDTLSGRFIMLPEYIQNYVENWDDNFEEERWSYDTPFRLNDVDELNALPVTLNDPFIQENILESLTCHQGELSISNLLLPELRNVPFDVLLKLREDEHDAFARFHHAIKRLIRGPKAEQSESALRTLFEEVDYEVRCYESRLRTVSRSRALNAYEAIVAVTVVGLCIALPSDYAKIISAIMGSYSAKEFIKNLFQSAQAKAKLEESDFYVPWKCTQLKRESPDK